jgi:hypothetical protein
MRPAFPHNLIHIGTLHSVADLTVCALGARSVLQDG